MTFVVRILTGQVQELNDVREYDMDDGKKSLPTETKDRALQIPNSCKDG